jgi:hypothetical protein
LLTTEPSPKGRLVAITAACPVFLAHQDDLERTENQANLAFLEHPACPVVLHWKFARKSHRRHADHAHLVHPALPVHLANLVHPDQTATPAVQAKMVVTDHPAQLAPTVLPAALAKMEKKDPLVLQLLASHRPLVMLVLLEKMAHPVQLVKTVLPVQMAVPAQQETKAHPVRLARPATTELLETKDHPVQMDPKENRVFAPNIAPPMAVFSSKMEQGDKRSHPSLCFTDEKPVFFMSMFFAFFFFFIIFVFNGQKSSSLLHLHHSSSSTNTAAASPVISFGAF